MYLLDLFGEVRGSTNGAISCAFDWANFGSVDVFFTNGEYSFSFKTSWYWIFNLRTKLCVLLQKSEISSGLHCKNFILDM